MHASKGGRKKKRERARKNELLKENFQEQKKSISCIIQRRVNEWLIWRFLGSTLFDTKVHRMMDTESTFFQTKKAQLFFVFLYTYKFLFLHFTLLYILSTRSHNSSLFFRSLLLLLLLLWCCCSCFDMKIMNTKLHLFSVTRIDMGSRWD